MCVILSALCLYKILFRRLKMSQDDELSDQRFALPPDSQPSARDSRPRQPLNLELAAASSALPPDVDLGVLSPNPRNCSLSF